VKIGLALGSGAARGLAHIGILKAFEEAGIRPYAISGSSMGAFIGGLYASGYPVGKLEEFILGLDFSVFKNFVDFKLSKAGLVDGKKLKVFWNLSLKQGKSQSWKQNLVAWLQTPLQGWR